jgi:hypothetical protein
MSFLSYYFYYSTVSIIPGHSMLRDKCCAASFVTWFPMELNKKADKYLISNEKIVVTVMDEGPGVINSSVHMQFEREYFKESTLCQGKTTPQNAQT